MTNHTIKRLGLILLILIFAGVVFHLHTKRKQLEASLLTSEEHNNLKALQIEKLEDQVQNLDSLNSYLDQYRLKSYLDDQLLARHKTFHELKSDYLDLELIPDFDVWLPHRSILQKMDARASDMRKERRNLQETWADKEADYNLKIEALEQELDPFYALKGLQIQLNDSIELLNIAVKDLETQIKDQVDILEIKKGKYTIKYFGEKEEGKANGYGVGLWSSGGTYRGYWKDNMRHGNGRYEWKDGEVYEGDYRDGYRTGEGKYTWNNGEYYIGTWHQDKRHGQGTIYHPDHKVKYQGHWDNDKFTASISAD